MNNLPSLRQIKSFQAVVDLGNFSRAAERLRTSQASVSHAIRELETLLDVRLFDRTTRSVVLTEAGRLFAAGALPGLTEIQHAVEAMDDLRQLRFGLVRIAAPPLLAARVLPRLLAEVAKMHADLRLRIEDVGTDVIAARVRGGLCDIGIGTFKRDEEGVERQRALTDRLMVFMPPDHPFAAEEEVPWKHLVDQRIVTLTRESEIRLLTEMGFQSADIVLRPTLEVHQIYTALALVESGAGVAVLPSYALTAVRRGELTARSLCQPHITREVSLITARDRGLSAATSKVHGLLRKMLREMVPDNSGNDTSLVSVAGNT